MKKDRKLRAVAIIALCVSILGLSLGFAAFSNTLTISSSATVSPDPSDFKLTLYGLPTLPEYDQTEASDLEKRDKIAGPINNFTSKVTSEPIIYHSWDAKNLASTAVKNAIITDSGNGSLTISNISATFTEPYQGAEYYFVLKNEGQYDAYINVWDTEIPAQQCTAAPGTTEKYVEEACDSVRLITYLALPKSDGTYSRIIDDQLDERGNVKIPKGGDAYIMIRIQYWGEERADGPFDIKFDDLVATFSTVAK